MVDLPGPFRGPNSPQPQAPRATNGGKQTPKPLPYSPPKGPSGMMKQGPGLGGTNHGNCGTQGKR